MASLDIEQAARASGLTARDVRLLIERGKLPATRPAGRWLIDQRHLASASGPTRPGAGAEAARPVGAATPRQDTSTPAQDTSTLLARLEEAEAQVADLREERDQLRLRLREQVSSLQHSLEDSMQELDEARARLAELERPRPVEPPTETAAGTGSALGVRDALTPLFRATTQARDVGSRDDR